MNYDWKEYYRLKRILHQRMLKMINIMDAHLLSGIKPREINIMNDEDDYNCPDPIRSYKSKLIIGDQKPQETLEQFKSSLKFECNPRLEPFLRIKKNIDAINLYQYKAIEVKMDTERLELCIVELEKCTDKLTQVKDRIFSVMTELKELGIDPQLDYSGDLEYFTGLIAERLRNEFDLNE